MYILRVGAKPFYLLLYSIAINTVSLSSFDISSCVLSGCIHKKTGMVIIKSVFIKWAKYYSFLLEIHVLMTCLGVCISLIYLRYLLTIFHLSYFTI